MTPEHYARLQDLGDKLVDVVLIDANPDNWVGKGLNPNQLTQQERGDAYWCRKMAVASLSVLTKIANLTEIIQNNSKKGSSPVNVSDDRLLEDEVKAAEKEGEKLLSDLLKRKAEKIKVTKTAHGKP